MASIYDNSEYVSFKEVKVPSKNAGERFFLKFYLVKKNGGEVLAVTAEDQGDAHYCYKNSRGFNQYGVLESHSRKEVIMWLEKIIHESALRAKEESGGMERMTVKTAEHPEGIYFVSEEQKYTTFPDGRRCTEWHLIDNHGVSHQAVVGEENHARDGHYVYRSVEPFSSIRQLECRNKAGVYHWLEIWIVHDDGLQREKQKERHRRLKPKRRPVVLDVGGPSSKSLRKGMLSVRSPVRAKDPEVHPDIVRAHELAREKEKLMLDAINFCFSKATECEIEAANHWIRIIKEMKNQWSKGNVFSSSSQEVLPPLGCAEVLDTQQEGAEDEKVDSEDFIYLKRNFYGLCLEAFREVGTMFVSIDVLEKTDLPHLVASFKEYPDVDLSAFATHICNKWSVEIQKHRRTLTSPDMLVDPLDSVLDLLK